MKTLLLPLSFTLGLAGFGMLAPVREHPRVLWAFLGAAAVLSAWNAALLLWSRRSGRTFAFEVVLKKQHYVQACVQAVVFSYWGWYWPPVYSFAPFILAQLVFAYAFDMLLAWSRRKTYTLGFGPFPIICSINLFLWFKPDWFYLQFLLVALGFAAKELIRWERDGRRAHIFNPSSFPLAVFSLALLATNTSGITWGQEIATTQFYPPQMYLVLFLAGMPGQFLFGVASMTLPAVLSTYIFGLLYFSSTGVYFFYDSYIPISVFLGMHLLFTDPSTSPRTDAGRVLFGLMYGLSTVGLYDLLGSAGLPTFYDKLLQVPLMNLSVRWIDGLARRWTPNFYPHKLAYIFTWAAVFLAMSFFEGVGDNHPGQWLPFWRQACQDGRRFACPYLADLNQTYCGRGSGWACNEAGLMHIALARSGEDLRRLDPAGAAEPLRRGCQLGFAVACHNLRELSSGSMRFAAAPPELEDFPIILRGSKGEIQERAPAALYALACRQGWPDTCAPPNAPNPPASGVLAHPQHGP